MTARQVVQLWVDTFNKKDPQALANLYHENAAGPISG
jgi:ketosteroid isomerase-like protein